MMTSVTTRGHVRVPQVVSSCYLPATVVPCCKQIRWDIGWTCTRVQWSVQSGSAGWFGLRRRPIASRILINFSLFWREAAKKEIRTDSRVICGRLTCSAVALVSETHFTTTHATLLVIREETEQKWHILCFYLTAARLFFVIVSPLNWHRGGTVVRKAVAWYRARGQVATVTFGVRCGDVYDIVGESWRMVLRMTHGTVQQSNLWWELCRIY